jgi:hypothetical protein
MANLLLFKDKERNDAEHDDAQNDQSNTHQKNPPISEMATTLSSRVARFFTFTVPAVPKGAKVEVRLTARCNNGWFGCSGYIEMKKN